MLSIIIYDIIYIILWIHHHPPGDVVRRQAPPPRIDAHRFSRANLEGGFFISFYWQIWTVKQNIFSQVSKNIHDLTRSSRHHGDQLRAPSNPLYQHCSSHLVAEMPWQTENCAQYRGGIYSVAAAPYYDQTENITDQTIAVDETEVCGYHGGPIQGPLKPIVHYSSIVLTGLRGTPN